MNPNDVDWKVHFEGFRDDVVSILAEGPLEHVSNLETIINDALIEAGLPGVFKLINEYNALLEAEKARTKHFLDKSMGKPPKEGACKKCEEDNPNKLMVPDTVCHDCFLDTFEKYRP